MGKSRKLAEAVEEETEKIVDIKNEKVFKIPIPKKVKKTKAVATLTTAIKTATKVVAISTATLTDKVATFATQTPVIEKKADEKEKVKNGSGSLILSNVFKVVTFGVCFVSIIV